MSLTLDVPMSEFETAWANNRFFAARNRVRPLGFGASRVKRTHQFQSEGRLHSLVGPGPTVLREKPGREPGEHAAS